jgi:RNA polymerase sigma-70 factor (ECF subfamily)
LARRPYYQRSAAEENGVQELIPRAQEGDRDAFEAIAAPLVDRLFAMAVRILSDQHDAEDAVQNALVDAWRDLPKLRDPGRFEAWMYRVLVRSCYNQVGTRRRFGTSVRELRLEPASDDSSAALADRDSIERAFRRLSPEHRAVVALHHYFDMALTETAETLGIPEGTARSRLHYALRAMRAALESDDRETVPTGRPA